MPCTTPWISRLAFVFREGLAPPVFTLLPTNQIHTHHVRTCLCRGDHWSSALRINAVMGGRAMRAPTGGERAMYDAVCLVVGIRFCGQSRAPPIPLFPKFDGILPLYGRKIPLYFKQTVKNRKKYIIPLTNRGKRYMIIKVKGSSWRHAPPMIAITALRSVIGACITGSKTFAIGKIARVFFLFLSVLTENYDQGQTAQIKKGENV